MRRIMIVTEAQAQAANDHLAAAFSEPYRLTFKSKVAKLGVSETWGRICEWHNMTAAEGSSIDDFIATEGGIAVYDSGETRAQSLADQLKKPDELEVFEG